MKQLKSYFQRVDELKNQLKNMSVVEGSPEVPKNTAGGYKERASSRDRSKPKPSSFNASRKGESSLSRLYAPSKKERSSSRYKPRSTSETKQQNSRSQSHFTSTDYDKLKMSYLKNLVKRPQESTARPAR